MIINMQEVIIAFLEKNDWEGNTITLDLSDGVNTYGGQTLIIEPAVNVLEAETHEDRDTFSPAEVLEALKDKFEIASNLVTIDMRQPNTHNEVTLETISYKQSEHTKLLECCLETKKTDDLAGTPVIGRKMVVPAKGYSKDFREATDRVAGYDITWGTPADTDLTCSSKEDQLVLTPTMLVYFLNNRNLGSDLDFEYTGYQIQVTKIKERKPRQLKRLGQLKGLTIESVKMVKRATKAYIKTTDGAGICIEGVNVIQTLAPDENIALGLLTKEDLASIAKAKKMGLLL